MRGKTLLGRRTAALAVAALIAIGLSSCGFADTQAAPPGDAYTNQIFQALNQDRVNNGLPPFTWSPKLANSAQNWAQQMANDNNLYHQNLSGMLNSPDYQNYRTIGENIIVGPGSMSGVDLESAWRASPPHWANITSGSFNIVGIGYVRGPDGRVWAVQDFGGL